MLGDGDDLFAGQSTFTVNSPLNYVVDGGAGNDIFVPRARGTYVIKPGAGNDKIVDTGFITGFSYQAFVKKNDGDDDRKITIDYSTLTTAVVVDLVAGTATSTGKNDTLPFTGRRQHPQLRRRCSRHH